MSLIDPLGICILHNLGVYPTGQSRFALLDNIFDQLVHFSWDKVLLDKWTRAQQDLNFEWDQDLDQSRSWTSNGTETDTGLSYGYQMGLTPRLVSVLDIEWDRD